MWRWDMMKAASLSKSVKRNVMLIFGVERPNSKQLLFVAEFILKTPADKLDRTQFSV